MGPLFVIIFWLIFVSFFTILWIGSLILFLVGWRKKKRLLKWLGLAPLAGLTLFALLIAGVFAVVVVRMITPKYVFADSFGEKPNADVVNIRSKVWSFADEGDVYLQFQAPPETFHHLMQKRLKGPVANSPYLIDGSDRPNWWRSVDPANSEIYVWRNPGEGRFASETILMTYEPRDRIVQYHYVGID
jgi:hypothetical protein